MTVPALQSARAQVAPPPARGGGTGTGIHGGLHALLSAALCSTGSRNPLNSALEFRGNS